MGVEIERKFLVIGTAWREHPYRTLRQGYLSDDPQRTVRVRMDDDTAFLTIKGATVGVTRPEFEYAIPVQDAERMLALCERPPVEKRRYVVPFGGMTWEVDEFLGANEGLVVAELELTSEGQAFERPPWLGEEVSDQPRYFNAQLAVTPFRDWPPPLSL